MKENYGGKWWKRSIVKKETFFVLKKKHASPFWKGVILAAQAVKMGYMWSVGKGDKVRFWEDTWFGSAPLAVQF
jgi:hypothetical protein